MYDVITSREIPRTFYFQQYFKQARTHLFLNTVGKSALTIRFVQGTFLVKV